MVVLISKLTEILLSWLIDSGEFECMWGKERLSRTVGFLISDAVGLFLLSFRLFFFYQ